MNSSEAGRTYYLISELQIVGDEQRGGRDYLEELPDFLERLEETEENAGLVINGDTFVLWESTTHEGIEKFDVLVESYPELIEQLHATGENISVTLLPGNHDHELAACDGCVERFAEYNVDLVRSGTVTRPVGDCEVHFEHGQQHDPNNRIEEWGNPYATPLGYYLNTRVLTGAGPLSKRGPFDWLKRLQAVTPTERTPAWVFSKYFYCEMNPRLRYWLVPFLFLLNISATLAIFAGLDLVGVRSAPVEWITAYLSQFDTGERVLWFFLGTNVAIAGLLLPLAVPLSFFRGISDRRSGASVSSRQSRSRVRRRRNSRSPSAA